MKLLYVHAHFDDFEFTAAGTFELWRRRLGPEVRRKVIVCTDGCAGHHFRTRAETGRLRLAEQQESARLGGYEFEPLRLPDGRVPREACLRVDIPLLAALWKAIRDFQPDYLFCPPLPADPLAGVHVDHVAVAQAVREVAYMINVPHAFTPEYPTDETRSEPCPVPVIVAVYDGYMQGENSHDLAVDVEPAFEEIARLTWCHQSQIREWLPWVGRHNLEAPADLEAWRQTLRARFDRKRRELNLPAGGAVEVFTVTGWGEIPDPEQLLRDFPNLLPDPERHAMLRQRLHRWRGD
jgi:LmbE family N-acetylglucosaminyl deacetylase